MWPTGQPVCSAIMCRATSRASRPLEVSLEATLTRCSSSHEAGLAGEGLLGALALGDVAEDAGEELAVALGPVRQRQLDGELGAVLAQRVHLDRGADGPAARG